MGGIILPACLSSAEPATLINAANGFTLVVGTSPGRSFRKLLWVQERMQTPDPSLSLPKMVRFQF